MCLSTVTETFEKDPLNEVDAWKVFVFYNSHKKKLLPPLFQSVTIYPNVWIKDPNVEYDIATRSGRSKYKGGFHSFLKKEDAEAYEKSLFMNGDETTVLPIKCRGVTTKGTQDFVSFKKDESSVVRSAESIVSREIFVLVTEELL